MFERRTSEWASVGQVAVEWFWRLAYFIILAMNTIYIVG